jgi:hypothetical protein
MKVSTVEENGLKEIGDIGSAEPINSFRVTLIFR